MEWGLHVEQVLKNPEKNYARDYFGGNTEVGDRREVRRDNILQKFSNLFILTEASPLEVISVLVISTYVGVPAGLNLCKIR